MKNINQHEVTLALSGDIARARARMVNALEQFNYSILSEQPIHARRAARSAGYIWSANVLEYPATLLVKLKSAGERATLATVQYSIEDKMFFNNGDRETLSCEARAIVALAMNKARSTECSNCQAEGAANSRFCRRCGAPVNIEPLAELEVLRLTAALSAAREDIFSGVIALLIMSLILLPALLFAGPKAALIISVAAGGLFGSLGLAGLLIGMRRLHRAFNLKKEIEAPRQPAAITPLSAAPASITESTTALLTAKPENLPDSPQLLDRDLTASGSRHETKSF